MSEENDKLVIAHYKSVGRHGKQLIEEDVQAGSDTAKFLERMEQRRLATPCNIAIDMRGKVDDECEAYEFQSIVHHLDEKCIEIFETEAARYDGKYTVGVFEKVMSAEHTHKAQHEKEQQQRRAEQRRQQQIAALKQQQRANDVKDPLFMSKEQQSEQTDNTKASETAQDRKSDTLDEDEEKHEIQLIPFGYRSQRKENRLNYTSSIRAFLNDGREVTGKTTDVSLTGIKVSLFSNIEPLAKKSPIQIVFTALEEQHNKSFGKIEYQLIAQEKDHHDRVQLRLLRVDQSENESFNQFIVEFIKSYRSRYKIEMEDKLLSLYARAFERIYTAAAPITACLLHINNGDTQCLYTVTRAEEKNALKSPLISSMAAALPELIGKTKQQTHLLLETMVIKDNKRHSIYCAEREQLIKQELIDQFLKAGSQSHMIARIQITLQPVSAYDLNQMSSYLEPLNEIAPVRVDEINQHWQSMTHIAYFSIVEQKLNPESRLTSDDKQLEALSEFKLDDSRQKVWQLGYRPARKEPRYLYSTEAEINVDNQSFKGKTLDFSPSGMRIQLQQTSYIPTTLELNKLITVTLPEMQKLAKKTASLKNLSYRITQRHSHQQSISLKRDFNVKNHHGELFFTKLIKTNQSKLKECAEELESTTMASMLENMISSYLHGIPLFLTRFPGGLYAIDSAAATENANPLLWRFKQEQGFDFEPLNLNEFFAEVLRGKLNRRSQLSEAYTTRLFAKFSGDESEGLSLEVTQESAMKDTREVARFILLSRKNPNYRILHAHFLPPPYIKLEEFSEELREIRHNSSMRAKDFEQKIQQLVAIVEIEDISDFYRV